jgi:hypothetical protein
MNTLRKILIVVAMVLAVTVFAAVLRHYQLRFAVARYVAQLKARGEPLDLAAILPSPTPPDQNGAPDLLKGAALLDPSWNSHEQLVSAQHSQLRGHQFVGGI